MRLKRANAERRQSESLGSKPLRAGLVLLFAVVLCTFLDRSDIKGFGFDYFERFPRRVQLSFASRRHPDLVDWVRNQIVLVPISDGTFDPRNPQHLSGPPVPRHYHAKVIDELRRAGAKVIAFDLIFDLPGSPEKAWEDQKLAKAAGLTKTVIWASLVANEKDAATEPILPLPLFLQSSPYHGHVLVPQKSQRPEVDSIQAVIDYGRDQPVRAFGIMAALAKLGAINQPLQRGKGEWKIGDLAIPIDTQGFSRISYLGWSGEEGNEDFFPRVPYESLYNGAANSGFYAENHFFRDKIVIIGDSTTVGNDFRNTPIGYMWGPEIHAHMAGSLLLAAQKQYPLIRESAPLINLLVVVALSTLTCLLAAAWRIQWATVAAMVLLALYYTLNLWIFADYRLALHVIAPTTSMVLVLVGMLTERGLSEEHEKRRMRHLLQRYVSESIAEYVTTHPDKCYLGGERVTATVLFSDIRGFTSLAEKISPEEVLGLLNEYMEAMTEVVYRYDGTVDKFVGDGIMALFGVPAPSDNHAWQAVATAIDMQNELRRFHEIWTERGLPLFDIGIGINTGEMVFGNIGSSKRMDFSVIGDAVNLASRLEALNKEWGTRILITQTTYDSVKDQVQAQGPFPAAIRGKEEVVNVYEILDWNNDENPVVLSLSASATIKH